VLHCSADIFFEEREGAMQLGILPFYHIYSIIATFLSGLAWGQTTVVLPGFDPRLFLEVVPKYKVITPDKIIANMFVFEVILIITLQRVSESP
jgi:acyl-CoA synthetase (AMP-forming)/AMP-acid ligase II